MVDSLTKPLANHHRKIADKCQSCLVNSLMYFLVGVLFLFESFSRKGFVFDFGRPVSIYRILKHGSASEKEQKREREWERVFMLDEIQWVETQFRSTNGMLSRCKSDFIQFSYTCLFVCCYCFLPTASLSLSTMLSSYRHRLFYPKWNTHTHRQNNTKKK